MQKVYFSGYSDLNGFPTVGKVAGVLNETNYYNLSKVPLIYDKNYDTFQSSAYLRRFRMNIEGSNPSFSARQIAAYLL